MRRLRVEAVVLCALLALLIAIALNSASSPPSTYSTYDTGVNGYRAVYGVLQRSGVDVFRLEAPLGQLSAKTRVYAVTPAQLPVFGSSVPLTYSPADLRRLRAFVAGGGTIVSFGAIRDLKTSKRVIVLDALRYTNAALEARPANAIEVYDALAGRGPVAFDERIHGYDRTRSLWAVLPQTVRVGCWIALAALVLWLIDSNLRFTPALSVEPPAERDSSDYVISMARLLRRARAGRAAIARFAAAYPRDAQLASLAAQSKPGNDAVLAAAIRYSTQRKERHDR